MYSYFVFSFNTIAIYPHTPSKYLCEIETILISLGKGPNGYRKISSHSPCILVYCIATYLNSCIRIRLNGSARIAAVQILTVLSPCPVTIEDKDRRKGKSHHCCLGGHNLLKSVSSKLFCSGTI